MAQLNGNLFKQHLNRLMEGIREFIDSGEGEQRLERIRRLFADETVRDWIFGPFTEILDRGSNSREDEVRRVISSVALINAVLAGLPGKLGIGVVITIAAEIYMALKIARLVGVGNRVQTPEDLLEILVSMAGSGILIFVVFKEILNGFFSLFNLVGALPATVLSELFATNLLGILFWIGFEEMKADRPFRIPRRLAARATRETRALLTHQWTVIRRNLSPANLKRVGQRLKAWFTGEVIFPPVQVRDDTFTALAMATVLAGDEEALKGPLGQMFIQSIRDLYPDLHDASVPEMGRYFAQYNEAQMSGVLNQVKGTLHEYMVAAAETADGDAWIAKRFDDPYHPSTDLIYTNTETGETYELSLKATDSPSYIEHALARYPHDPIAATDEVSGHFDDDPRVTSSGVSLEHLNEVTEKNFEQLLHQQPPVALRVAEGVAASSALRTTVVLWPYFIAWKRERITQEQFQTAAVHILGDTAGYALPRLCGGLVLGAVFGWYLLARSVFRVSMQLQTPAQDVLGEEVEILD